MLIFQAAATRLLGTSPSKFCSLQLEVTTERDQATAWSLPSALAPSESGRGAFESTSRTSESSVALISEMVGLTAIRELGSQAKSHQRSEPQSALATSSDATLRLRVGVEIPGKASGSQARRVPSLRLRLPRAPGLGTVMCVFTLTLLVAISVIPELTRVLRLCQWPGAPGQLEASGALAGPRWQADRHVNSECRGGHGLGVHAAISPGERQALVNLYLSTNGPGWTASKVTGWSNYADPNVDPCTASWTGVSCSAGGTSVVYVPLSFSQT